jgi:hypothetical protein
MAPLSFPNLGDQTLAVRMNLKIDGLEAVSDLVVVAVGHNIVSFSTSGFSTMKGAELEQLTRAGMSKLAAAAQL